MKTLYKHLNESLKLNSVKYTFNKLKSLFKKKEEHAYETPDKHWERVEQLYYEISKTGPVQSFMEVKDLANAYMKGSIKFEDTMKNKRQYAAFIQGMLDYAYLNYKEKVDTDKFGESSCDKAYNRACEEYGYVGFNQELNSGAVGSDVFGYYPYGWGFAERLGLKVSHQWLVSFKTTEPIKIN